MNYSVFKINVFRYPKFLAIVLRHSGELHYKEVAEPIEENGSYIIYAECDTRVLQILSTHFYADVIKPPTW